MGQFLSGVAPGGSGDGSAQSTPKNTRMTVDPRSPTLEFDRTPVKVESTPQLAKAAAGGDVNDGENLQQQLQLAHRAPETTPATARERPRTLHQKMIAEKHKKMAAEQQPTATTPTSY